MAELFEMKEEEERVILAAVETGDGDGARVSLKELEELASTAGAVTVGTVIQNRENIHPGTYLGKGKLEELKEMIWERQATGIIAMIFGAGRRREKILLSQPVEQLFTAGTVNLTGKNLRKFFLNLRHEKHSF